MHLIERVRFPRCLLSRAVRCSCSNTRCPGLLVYFLLTGFKHNNEAPIISRGERQWVIGITLLIQGIREARDWVEDRVSGNAFRPTKAIKRPEGERSVVSVRSTLKPLPHFSATWLPGRIQKFKWAPAAERSSVHLIREAIISTRFIERMGNFSQGPASRRFSRKLSSPGVSFRPMTSRIEVRIFSVEMWPYRLVKRCVGDLWVEWRAAEEV